ncbi:MAG: condensation domain-containing protein, partial [Acidobacteriota bacterium]|nr:condensation domain-containing protein [Acidobacteriota bacterium]
IGTPETCIPFLDRLRAIGVDEIGCLVDFGVAYDATMHSLGALTELKDRYNAPRVDLLPLTEGQRELWTLMQLEPQSTAYNETVQLRIEGRVDRDKLRRALQTLSDRHDSLRVIQIDGESQHVAGHIDAAITDDFAPQPFATDGPLWRCALRQDDDAATLQLTAHHIIANGWSLGIFIEELSALYDGQSLPPATPLRDFIEWSASRAHEANDFWRHKLAQWKPGEPLRPVHRPSGIAARHTLSIEAAALKRAARGRAATMFMLALGAFEILVARLRGRRSFAVGIPLSQQAQMGAIRLAGQCTTMMPALVDLHEGATIDDVLRAARRDVLDLHEQSDVSFAALAAEGAAVSRFDAMFNMDRAPSVAAFAGMPMTLETAPAHDVKFDLSLNVIDFGDHLLVECDARDGDDASAWLDAYTRILERIADPASAATPIDDLPLCDEHPIGASDPMARESVVAAIERMSREHPHAPAIAGSLTFAQLDRAASGMAIHLTGAGVLQGMRVALFFRDRTLQLVVRLALLKAGAIPMEAAYGSVAGFLRMIDDAQFVVTEPQFADQLTHDAIVAVDAFDADADAVTSPYAQLDALAAAFYTDTHRLELTHRELASQCATLATRLGFAPGARLALANGWPVDLVLAALARGAAVTTDVTDASATAVTLPLYAISGFEPRAALQHLLIESGHLRDGHLRRAELRDAARVHAFVRPGGIPLVGAMSLPSSPLTLMPLLPSLVRDEFGAAALPAVTGEWYVGECATGDFAEITGGSLRHRGSRRKYAWIRGELVDLAEVEALLLLFVDDAVAVAQLIGKDEPELVAYVVASHAASIEQLRRELAGVAPAALVPSYFVRVGRIAPGDREHSWQLVVTGGALQSGLEHVAATTPTEMRLAALVSDVLQVPSPGVSDSLFTLGAQSMQVAQLATRIRSDIGAELSLKDLFEAATIRDLARLIDSRSGTAIAPIARVADAPDYALSRAQHRLWIQQQLHPAVTAYTIPLAVWLDGPLDRDLFVHSLETLVERHEALRTTFVVRDGEPRQVVGAARLDFEELSVADEQSALAFAESEAARPFDLINGPLFRARLVRAGERHLFVATMHHIISDGWSIGVLAHELSALHRGETLPPLALQYRDYAAWQPETERDREFWTRTFATPAPRLAMTTDHPRPAIRGYAGATASVQLGHALSAAVRRHAAESASSVFVVLIAAVDALLHRLTGDSDVVVGVPVTGRDRAGLESQVGFYVNMLPLRDRVHGEMSFDALASSVRANALESFEHGAYPFDLLVCELDLARDWSRNPLFDVIVTADEVESLRFDFGGVTVTRAELPQRHALVDLLFRFADLGGDIRFDLDYDTSLFRAATAARMQQQFVTLLRAAVSRPAARIVDIDLTTDQEKDAASFRLEASFRL